MAETNPVEKDVLRPEAGDLVSFVGSACMGLFLVLQVEVHNGEYYLLTVLNPFSMDRRRYFWEPSLCPPPDISFNACDDETFRKYNIIWKHRVQNS